MLTKRDSEEIVAIHRDYVDSMYEKFGIVEHLGYSIVEVRPLLSRGGFFYNPDTIWIDDTLVDIEEIRDTVCHESGHFLHPFARRECQSRSGVDEGLCEIIVHLGNLIYFGLRGEKGAEGYISRQKNSTTLDELRIARNIFESNPELLEEISNTGMEWIERF